MSVVSLIFTRVMRGDHDSNSEPSGVRLYHLHHGRGAGGARDAYSTGHGLASRGRGARRRRPLARPTGPAAADHPTLPRPRLVAGLAWLRGPGDGGAALPAATARPPRRCPRRRLALQSSVREISTRAPRAEGVHVVRKVSTRPSCATASNSHSCA